MLCSFLQVNIYLGNDDGKTPLHLAITRGHLDVVKKIAEHRSFRWRNVSFQDLVWEALSVNNYVMACKLLSLQPEFAFSNKNIPVLIGRCKALSEVISTKLVVDWRGPFSAGNISLF